MSIELSRRAGRRDAGVVSALAFSAYLAELCFARICEYFMDDSAAYYEPCIRYLLRMWDG